MTIRSTYTIQYTQCLCDITFAMLSSALTVFLLECSHKSLYCDCDNGTWLGANVNPSDVSEEARTETQSQQTNKHSRSTCCEVK